MADFKSIIDEFNKMVKPDTVAPPPKDGRPSGELITNADGSTVGEVYGDIDVSNIVKDYTKEDLKIIREEFNKPVTATSYLTKLLTGVAKLLAPINTPDPAKPADRIVDIPGLMGALKEDGTNVGEIMTKNMNKVPVEVVKVIHKFVHSYLIEQLGEKEYNKYINTVMSNKIGIPIKMIDAQGVVKALKEKNTDFADAKVVLMKRMTGGAYGNGYIARDLIDMEFGADITLGFYTGGAAAYQKAVAAATGDAGKIAAVNAEIGKIKVTKAKTDGDVGQPSVEYELDATNLTAVDKDMTVEKLLRFFTALSDNGDIQADFTITVDTGAKKVKFEVVAKADSSDPNVEDRKETAFTAERLVDAYLTIKPEAGAGGTAITNETQLLYLTTVLEQLNRLVVGLNPHLEKHIKYNKDVLGSDQESSGTTGVGNEGSKVPMRGGARSDYVSEFNALTYALRRNLHQFNALQQGGGELDMRGGADLTLVTGTKTCSTMLKKMFEDLKARLASKGKKISHAEEQQLAQEIDEFGKTEAKLSKAINFYSVINEAVNRGMVKGNAISSNAVLAQLDTKDALLVKQNKLILKANKKMSNILDNFNLIILNGDHF